jgi:hypothetical protein
LDRGELSFGLNGVWNAPSGKPFRPKSLKRTMRTMLERNSPAAVGLYPALTSRSARVAVNLGDRPWKFGPPSRKYGAVAQHALFRGSHTGMIERMGMVDYDEPLSEYRASPCPCCTYSIDLAAYVGSTS